MDSPSQCGQKESMGLPVLLFLVTRDPIVGGPGFAKQTAEEYPDIRIDALESGHLVAVEQKVLVNSVVQESLSPRME